MIALYRCDGGNVIVLANIEHRTIELGVRFKSALLDCGSKKEAASIHLSGHLLVGRKHDSKMPSVVNASTLY